MVPGTRRSSFRTRAKPRQRFLATGSLAARSSAAQALPPPLAKAAAHGGMPLPGPAPRCQRTRRRRCPFSRP
eukprot:5644511-Pyramimonas_sp.AAC.1